MTQANLSRAVQALDVQFTMLSRLSALVCWLGIGLVHLALWLLLMTALWLAQVSPQDVARVSQQMLQSTPGAVLAALGLSLGTVLTAYAWLLRKVHTAIGGGWLLDYLLKGLAPQ